MVKWRLIFTRQAQQDAAKLAQAGLRPQAERLPEILANDPYQAPPPYENLPGDLAGACSRRINIQHRLVYQVIARSKTAKVIRLWSHRSQRGSGFHRAACSTVILKNAKDLLSFFLTADPSLRSG